jgi:cytochrome c nitrite reductase small subunit
MADQQQWVRRLWAGRWLALVALVGMSLGAGGYTFYYARGASYLSNDPKACANCHVMQTHFDGWQKSSHHAVATCNDCHAPHNLIGKYLTKMENGYHHSKAFTLQDFPDVIRIRERNARILRKSCLHCHEPMVEQLVEHGGTKAEPMDCVRCHADVGHGPRR